MAHIERGHFSLTACSRFYRIGLITVALKRGGYDLTVDV